MSESIKLLYTIIAFFTSVIGLITIILKILFIRSRTNKAFLILKLIQKNYGQRGHGPFNKFELRYWFEYNLINSSSNSITDLLIIQEFSTQGIKDYFTRILKNVNLLPPHKEVDLDGFTVSKFIKPDLIYKTTVEDNTLIVHPGTKVQNPSKEFEDEITKKFEVVIKYTSDSIKYYLYYSFNEGVEKSEYYKYLQWLRIKFQWEKLKRFIGLSNK